MKKETAQKVITVLPKSLKNISGYFKDNFDKSGQDILSNATGTVGIFIQFFGKDKVDAYFTKLAEKKLENFGSDIYLQASLLQVGKSIEAINDEAVQLENASSVVTHFMDNLDIEVDAYSVSDILTIFTPKYHPIVLFVKEQMQKLLSVLHLPSQPIDSFTRDYNKNIEATVVELFGEDYEEHKESVKEFLINESESKLLLDMHKLRNIGFKDGESLKYEETFASWKSVASFLKQEEESRSAKEHKVVEDNLKPIEMLIEDYFEGCSTNCTNHILFAVADFGKGKSVFLKQYAAKLAQEYSQTREGFIPVYFNLRNFHSQNYVRDSKLGILESYLDYEYDIKINDEHFRKQKYIFLIDSLDESGSLVQSKIDAVLESIMRINSMNGRIDNEGCMYKQNRIVISSRPFSDVLKSHLTSHNPFTKKDTDKNDIMQYLSLYGFKENQFNDWLYSTLESDIKELETIESKGFVKEVIKSIKDEKPINIYQKLLDEKTLSRTELRRPIFSYMIYQLILNSVDFVSIGKIGVYLSFINLLTKQAKHVDDKNALIDQQEERNYRNILHSISALWMHKYQQGEQGILDKYDVCRVLDGRNSEANEKFLTKHEKVIDIEFFSNSYFGENNNKLHFQHQSFAEILLAEYYLKVFIQYALEEQIEIDTARKKLVLGEPTEQTILFFKELLRLLKDTVSDEVDEKVIEKRKLLYPLFSSLSSKDFNPLFSNAIYYSWFKGNSIKNDSSTIPDEMLMKWAISKDDLEKIMDLAQEIIDSKTTLLLVKTEQGNSLFDNELTVLQNARVSDAPSDMDKWLALVVGNLLHDDVPEERKFFNGRLQSPENLFEMIRGWNYCMNDSAPNWARGYFKGINLNASKDISFQSQKITNIDFSYSILKNCNLTSNLAVRVVFDSCVFDNVDLRDSYLSGTSFNKITIVDKGLNLEFAQIQPYYFLPKQLIETLVDRTYMGYKYQENYILDNLNKNTFLTLKGLLLYGLKNNFFDISEIKSWFEYQKDKDRKEFETLIDGLVDEV